MSKLNTYEKLGLVGGGIAVLWFAYTYFYYNSDYKKFKEKYCTDTDNDGSFDNPFMPYVENDSSFTGSIRSMSNEKNCKNSYSFFKFGNYNVENTKGNLKAKLIMKLI